jgi:aminoglycoside phosphotransferase (APT) family kinase protein
MRIEIPNFRGNGAREAKLAVYRHFSGVARQNWHFYSDLDEMTGTAVYGGFYLSSAWTGRTHDRPQFSLSAYRRVAALRPRLISNLLLRAMKKLQGIGR